MFTHTPEKTGFIFILTLIFSLGSFAQPKANFSSNKISGCAPLLVDFTDRSTGNPLSWNWDLGNGTISYLQNPSVVFFNPGQYHVKLVVKNNSGADSILKNQYITVYANPKADLSVSSISGCAPLSVDLKDLSTPGDGVIQSWKWDFGDGTFGQEKNPNHLYVASGNFNVSLLVKNSYGCSATVTKKELIKFLEKPSASFTNSSVNTCGTPQIINFQNNSTGSGTFSYKWDFGDGSVSTENNPSHTYTTGGTFTIKLYAKNENGCIDSSIKANAFTIQNIHTDFNIPVSACVNNPLTINNLTSPEATNTTWSFGDSTFSTETTPQKTFTKPGTYEIKLVNNFEGCINSITKTIIINEGAKAAFSASPIFSCQIPLIVNFKNESTNSSIYNWSFGDSTISTEVNPSKIYTKPGVYAIGLTVKSPNGCTDTLIKSEYINIQLPDVTIDNLPKKGCAPLEFTFTPTITGVDSIVHYEWNFGDGATSNLEKPTHTFQAGVYDISLIIVTKNGCRDTVVYKEAIKAGKKPTVYFSAEPRDVCAELPVKFKNLTTPSTGIDTADTFLWEFGDGGTSMLKDPKYIYRDTGKFSIQLIAESMGCADTLKIDDYVHILPPIAKFKTTPDCINRTKRKFTDMSIGADTWHWNFGDGRTSDEKNPVHIYSRSGTYTVELTVTNFVTGCEYTSSKDIIINNEKLDFKASETIICRDNTTEFSIIGNTTYCSGVDWNFGDQTTDSIYPVKKLYPLPGIYTIRLITTDKNKCIDTITKVDYITVNGPTAKFSLIAKSSCVLRPVTFNDNSYSDGRNPIAKYTWSYGDGNAETLTSGPFSHSYNTGGRYLAQLTVEDVQGCSHRDTSSGAISIVQPIANFNSIDTLSCPNKKVTFNNLSTGLGLSYLWNFGDGGTSRMSNPSHSYIDEGTYPIKLTVFNSIGCKDSITKMSFINIRMPRSSFTVSDTLGICPPLIVKFTNTSSFYSSLRWDFGDGTSATTEDPSHFYSAAGTYIAKLIITGPGGCVSVSEKKILVKGPSGSFTYGGLSGCAPYTINLKANTKGTISYVWDYHDGNAMASNNLTPSHIYNLPGVYVPKLILKDTAGCIVTVIGKDTVRVFDVTAGFGFDRPTICDSGAVTFNGNSKSNDIIKTFSWDFGDNNTSALQHPTNNYTRKGIYYPKLIVITEKGCKDTVVSKTPVKVAVSPVGAITQTANGCVDLTVRFNGRLAVADTAAMTWNWDFGNGKSSGAMNPDPQIYQNAGNYKVNLFITSSLGCKGTITTNVEAYAIPTIHAGNDITICEGKEKKLIATGGISYSWTPGNNLSCTDCPNPSAKPENDITYIVTGKSTQGCTGKDTIQVSVKKPFSMRVVNKDTLCKGESKRLYASGAHSYSWTPTQGLDNPNSDSPVASPEKTITYRVIGTDDNNCFTDTNYVPLIVYDLPSVDAGPDQSINVGKSIEIKPKISSDVIDARWTPTAHQFRSSFPNLNVMPRETTTYRVEVYNQGGCVSFDEVTINVLCDGANVFIPNTFSPNGDGMNDIFYPRGTGLFSIKNLRIFTRWGEVVYEQSNFRANDAGKGWDGTFKGSKLNSDVFVYIAEILCDNKSVLTFKGNVALVR